MIVEMVDRRVLGALRCVDAVSKAQVLEPLLVESDQLRLRRNASQLWVVFDGPGMHDVTTQFELTSQWPNPSDFQVSIRSISGRYLPRRASVRMPRTLDTVADPNAPPPPSPDSIKVPLDITLYPAPTASTFPNWALVRAWVTKNNSPEGLPWAVLRLTRNSDKSLITTGVANEKGDALLAIPGLGISASQNGGGAVTEPTIDATLTAYWDPGNQSQPASWMADPDVILNDLANPKWKTFVFPQPVKIGRGTLSKIKLPIPV